MRKGAWCLLGGVGYPLLEILWRGRTHYAMAVAGVLGGGALHEISQSELSFPCKVLAGGASITAIEAACGLIWNRQHRVWDYRKRRCNWQGQVCLDYALLWCLLSAGVLRLLDKDHHRE